MQSLLILMFSGLAAGQLFGLGPSGYMDRYHELTFEYHQRAHVLLARTRKECYFVRVDDSMAEALKQTSTRYQLEDKIYQQIHSHTGERKVDVNTLTAELHDFVGSLECILHDVYELTLTGSNPATAPPFFGTTMTPKAPLTSTPPETFEPQWTEETEGPGGF